jgi:hypothetical protein
LIKRASIDARFFRVSIECGMTWPRHVLNEEQHDR